MTLRELIEQHPEWADMPIAVASVCGDLDYIGDYGSGLVYEGEDFPDDQEYVEGEGDPVLIFSAN